MRSGAENDTSENIYESEVSMVKYDAIWVKEEKEWKDFQFSLLT